MKETNFVPRAAIFDMDGLMLDTERPCIPSWFGAAKNLGLTIKETVPASVIGMDKQSIRRIFMEAHGPDFPYDELHAEMRRLVALDVEKNGIPHRPGLLTLLDHLDAKGIPLAVATSTFTESAQKRLARAGILGRFREIACGDEVEHGKPAPDIFLLAAKKLEREVKVCAGFEDSPAGLLSLRNAGMRAVFVKDFVEPPPEITATVWRRFPSLADAVSLWP